MAGLKLYTPRRTIVAVAEGGKTHLLDKSGKILCGAEAKGVPNRRRGYQQTTLDNRPTCGWCILMANTETRQA